ncbi:MULTISPECIES: hypothetical protein [Natrialbaceae]|uniref:hypothetical protein n=1 Tax=Natrialbaceae TaxID=1644061 RepID=UPI00207CD82F|nr:hypothetical protein [Natronococcus sp. CG52]
MSFTNSVLCDFRGGIKSSEYHSESTETFFVHTPGIRVVCPSTPAETRGLLEASIRSDDPVISLEQRASIAGNRRSSRNGTYAFARRRTSRPRGVGRDCPHVGCDGPPRGDSSRSGRRRCRNRQE